MQIDKLFDEKLNPEITSKLNDTEKNRMEAHKRLLIIRYKNMESNILLLKQHYGVR